MKYSGFNTQRRMIDTEEFREQVSPYIDKYGKLELSITQLNIVVEKASVPLIRCKDCKYAECWDNFDPPIAQYFCEFMDANVELKGDDFCSKGEKNERRATQNERNV